MARTPSFALARRNLSPTFVDALLELLPGAYHRADEVAAAEFGSNRAYHRGTARWGKADDVLYRAAEVAGFPVKRVPADNGVTHTEVYTPEVVVVQKKVKEPGDGGSAAYRKRLCKNNGVLSLFTDDIEDLEPLDEDGRVFMELTHGPYDDDPTRIRFVYLVATDEEGNTIDYFPIQSLYPGRDTGDGGIETPPDDVWPTPRSGTRTGSDG